MSNWVQAPLALMAAPAFGIPVIGNVEIREVSYNNLFSNIFTNIL